MKCGMSGTGSQVKHRNKLETWDINGFRFILRSTARSYTCRQGAYKPSLYRCVNKGNDMVSDPYTTQ